MKTCCFIGHRKIEITDELVLSIRRMIKMLIEDEGVYTFVFGSKSMFNDLCHKIVTELKEEDPVIQRIFMTCKGEECVFESERQQKEKIFSNVLKKEIHLQGFEEEIEFKNKYSAGRVSYVERNQAMIDASDFCVFYFDEKYLPPEQKASRRSIFSYQPKSGTALAYKYAQKKKKHIINMFGYEKTA